jgi:hypothetical protein
VTTIESIALFSPCRKYRYVLSRVWDFDKQGCVFIGLNPSTADEKNDDSTIRRCINFSQTWGFGSLFMLNLFAFRATHPKDMKAALDPIGSENDTWIHAFSTATITDPIGLLPPPKIGAIVGAWGTHGSYLNRGNSVKRLILGLKTFGLTKNGEPKHPLYLRADSPLIAI